MSDFVTLIDGDKSGQVKCLCQSKTTKHNNTVQAGETGLSLSGLDTFSIALREGGYANVYEGEFQNISDEPEHVLFIFDKWGNQFDPANPSNGVLFDILKEYGVDDPYFFE